MRTLLLLALLCTASASISAAEPCLTFHGRAHFYSGDGQLRVWHIGTHHEFEPDQSTWDRVTSWLEAGVPPTERKNYLEPASVLYLFADFKVCPTEPFRQGAVQEARVLSATHRHYTDRTIPCKTVEVAPSCYKTGGQLFMEDSTPSYRLRTLGTNRRLAIYSGPLSFHHLEDERYAGDNEYPEIPSELNEAFSQPTSGGGTHIVSADFEVCPLEKEKPGAMQAACIESAKNIIIKKDK